MFARQNTRPALGRCAVPINVVRSPAMEWATSNSARQVSHAAMCARSSSPGAPFVAHSRTSNSRSHSRLAMQQLRKFPTCPEKKRLDALAAHAGDLGDLRMRGSLSVREPEDLALHRFQFL